MSEERPDQKAAPAGDSWEEVGRQFQSLGQSIAQAVRTTWEEEENQRRLQQLRDGLESMVQDVDKAIRETTESEQGQRIREEARKTASSIQDATETVIQEARPRILSALQQLNEELQEFVNKANKSGKPPSSSQS